MIFNTFIYVNQAGPCIHYSLPLTPRFLCLHMDIYKGNEYNKDTLFAKGDDTHESDDSLLLQIRKNGKSGP